jgi:Family of unknown function (DUF5990)
MPADEVRFRLLRKGDVPATNPHDLAFKFGLQDKDQNIVPGRKLPGGYLAFDFSLNVKKGKDPKYPVFTGAFASGPVDDRFVYLSWFAIKRGDYINRVKARLGDIDWKLVKQAQAEDRPLVADMTGRGPGGGRVPVEWELG